MNILALGDVFGEGGLSAVERNLRELKKACAADLTVINGENAAVLGITSRQAARLFDAGADVVTLGNHAFHRRDITKALSDNPYLIRPLNFSGELPGGGYADVYSPSGLKVRVVNLIGRCFMNDSSSDNAFRAIDRLLARNDADMYAVDFHAEATSEKLALAYYLDGRVSVLFGTHTHVPTADARILPNGMGYVTDLGMCGPIESVLGIRPEQSIGSYMGALPEKYEAAGGACKLDGAVFTVDEKTGRCTAVKRIDGEKI
ncbi:metallophosphoesterase [Clostridia bacterium]|nr:metallophosphoesterase [Clostridia bacterium]